MGTVHSGHRTSAADADRQGKSDTRFVEDMESWFPFFWAHHDHNILCSKQGKVPESYTA